MQLEVLHPYIKLSAMKLDDIVIRLVYNWN